MDFVHLSIRLQSKLFSRYMFVSVNRHDFKWCWKWKTYWYDFNRSSEGFWHLTSYSFIRQSEVHWFFCMRTTLAFFINMRTLRKSKMFSTRNLQMCANGLLIISCQFILVKIKLNAFFFGRALHCSMQMNCFFPAEILIKLDHIWLWR